MSDTPRRDPALPEGTAGLRAAVLRNPGDFLSWLLLADAEMDAGDLRAGEMAARRAHALRPGHPEALARLGRLAWMQGRYDDAVAALRQAVAAAPHHPGMALWLGHALEDAGQAEAAADAYAHAHALAPGEPYIAAQLLNWRRRLCDWRDLPELSGRVRKAVMDRRGAIEPFAFLSEDAGADEQLACARLRAAPIARQVRSMPAASRGGHGRIRAGFLSNGFGEHPTGLLTVALFEALAATDGACEIHLFALNRDDGGAIRGRLHRATRLHEVAGLAHAEVAERIRSAGIDVLFDLRGWGGGGAPEVLAMRPAPVQVNWLAFPGTSGAPWIDYVLADPFVLPGSMARHFSERVLYLPRCFQPSDTTRDVATPPSRRECGLPAQDGPDQGIVYCCFNNSYKINPQSFQRMAAVLRGTPGSVLWLLSGPGEADARLRTAAAGLGLDPGRLVFMPRLPHAQYLARYRHADLFLDTSPYNAHTTASDALWAGCPVLTRPGATFASRVAGSMNHHLGLESMNAPSDEAFVDQAIGLGHDPAALRALRDTLRDRRSGPGLFDMRGFARDFDATVRSIAGGIPGGDGP